MNIKPPSLVASLALTLGIYAHASSTITEFNLVFREPASYNNQWITIHGFVGVDELGHKYLFQTLAEAKEKKFTNSIDIDMFPDDKSAVRPLGDRACADIYGKFQAYGRQGVIPLGYLLSNAGLIKVARVSDCAN